MEHHTTHNENSFMGFACQVVQDSGIDGALLLMQSLLNQVMLIQRSQHLHAQPYERTEDRVDYANGFKPRSFNTGMGTMALSVPQTRKGTYTPDFLEKYQRTDKALMAAMCEMYLQGVSTRKVTKVLEELCGLEVSATQVSRVTAQLDEAHKVWREQPLGEMPYLLIDAKYQKVRIDKRVVSAAVMTAYAVDPLGNRRCIGCEVSLSEASIYWRKFLSSLVKRGLCGVKMVTSDSHQGLKDAVRTVFNGVEWQRCQFHLQQNAGQHVPRKDMQSAVAEDIASVFNSVDKSSAEELLQRVVAKYEKSAPSLAEWMEDNIPESLTVFNQPKASWKKLRTTNMVERQNREFVRRMRVISIFPNTDSLLRLLTAMCLEKDEEWIGSDKKYIKLG
jgi:putative transposase